MNSLRAFGRLVARSRRLAGLVIIVLPLVLEACTNASGSGSGY
jgi:hypothetical protein